MAVKLFVKFIVPYHNYNLYGVNDNLFIIVIKMYNNVTLMEYEDAGENYDKYVEIMIERDIYSLEDLTNPVNAIYYNYVKPNL